MKKLRRGLEDLSPLFHSTPSPDRELPPLVPSPVPFEAQFLSVCVPEHEGDAFFANAFLASQIVQQTHLFASLVSILPETNAFPPKSLETVSGVELLDSKISRVSLSREELWSFTNRRSKIEFAPPSIASPNFLVFLEFEPSQVRSLAQIALLLDRVVLFLQPEVESLREGYRVIKMLWNLNREIEFFLLFRNEKAPQAQPGFLFERFSLITSRFLGISPGWLGHLGFSSKEALQFNPESILSIEGLRRPLSPEKNRCWQALREIILQRFQPDFLPAAK